MFENTDSVNCNSSNNEGVNHSIIGLINWQQLNKLSQDLKLIPIGEKKNPIVDDWPNKGLSPADFIQMHKSNSKVKAVGVVTGANIIAVDVDGKAAGELLKFVTGSANLSQALPKTLKFTSGKPGRLHALYRLPEAYIGLLPNIKVFDAQGDKLELRYGAHQSVITGAHPDTGSYHWLEGCSPSDTDIAICPDWVIKLALDHPIDLFNLMKSKWKDHVLTGFNDPNDFQDNTGSELAFYLISLVNSCHKYGIKTTEPKDILKQYISNCSDNFTQKDIDRWLKGAIKKAPTSTINKAQNTDVETLELEDKNEILTEVQSLTQTRVFDISRIHPKPWADELEYQAGVFGQKGIVPSLMFLSIVSSLLGTETKIVVNFATEYMQSPVIWLGLVGDSDAGKSPLMRLLTKPLDKIQAESHQKYLIEIERYEEEMAIYQENRKKKSNEREKLEKPIKPIYRVYSFGDFTTEALVKHIEPQPSKGAIIIVDELAGYINSMDQYRSGNKGGDRQRWLSLYNGDSLNVVRAGKEPIFIPNTSLSIAGGIQPTTLRRLMGKTVEEVDGFWPRFTYVLLRNSIFPEPSKDHKSSLKEDLYNLYKILDNLPAKNYSLSEQAWQLWLKWHNETEHTRMNSKHPAISAIYRKYRDKAARFALAIHIHKAAYENMALNTQDFQWIREPDTLISRQTLEVAIDLVKYTINDTLSLYGDFDIGVNPLSSKVKKFLEKFKDPQIWISAKMINKSVYCGRGVVKDIWQFMNELVALGLCISNGESEAKFRIKLHKSDAYDVCMPKSPLGHEIEPGINHDVPMMPIDVPSQSQQEAMLVEDITDFKEASSLMPAPNSLTVSDSSQETSKTSLFLNRDPREFVKKIDEKLEINIEDLDFDYRSDIVRAHWEPTKKLDPYQNLSIIYLDIETTGLDSQSSRVIMVGLKHGESVTIFEDAEEKILLQKTLDYLNSTKANILIGHNLFEFDLPFLLTRSNKHQIKHNFKLGEREKTITASSFNGSPIKFTPVYFGNVQIIDTFQQICIWDKSANKLTSYNLKYAVITLGLRDQKRLELSNNEIQDCYKKGDLPTIRTYLTYDLEDTELLANFLVPIVYYQLKIVPNISLQELAVASPALKAQKIHQQLITGAEPQSDASVSFEGGKVTLHRPGLHRNVAKIDISSLYPSIMLTYGICSRKDPEHRFLAVLEYMTKERLRLKQLSKQGELKADQMQKALKILINGSYGFLGTGGYSFNDYQAAALVTAYGRKILNLMETVIQNNGGILIESDTDGVIFSAQDPETIVKGLNYELPEGIQGELEYHNCVAYVPKAKNYIVLKPDGKLENKGAKRLDLPLVKEFKLEFLKAYAQSESQAQDYYQNLIAELESGNYPLEKLTITRRIGKAEKNLVNLGIGQVGDTVSYYYGYSSSGKPAEVNTGVYNKGYYLEKIHSLMEEMTGIKLENDSGQQLSLVF